MHANYKNGEAVPLMIPARQVQRYLNRLPKRTV
jgi:hypothetical protein